MLLASCITPSGDAWVKESALAAAPGARICDWGEIDARGTALEVSASLGSLLVDGLMSVQRVSTLVTSWEQSVKDSSPWVVVVKGSVPELVADACWLSSLLNHVAPGSQIAARVAAVVDAAGSGHIEWLLATPPERAAIDMATVHIAQGVAAGMGIRGVLVAPIPRKSDGWPPSLRKTARRNVKVLRDRLYNVPVERARSGRPPTFTDLVPFRANATVTSDSTGDYLFSVTIPGAQFCDVEVGVWSDQSCYSTTHVVIRLDGVSARIDVDATLRRCTGKEAVVAGDTVAVTFTPDPDQWPDDAANVGGE